mgnify:CR=1 FL=1
MAKGKKITYTQAGYQKLIDELNYLKLEKREKIKNDIAVARSFGDLSENSEYDAARTAQAENEARILELEALIENAIVVDESSLDDGTIGLGSVVVLHDEEEDEEITYYIVGSNEVDAMEHRISDQSPIGQGVMGKREGDTVLVEAPYGMLTFRILRVARQSQTD